MKLSSIGVLRSNAVQAAEETAENRISSVCSWPKHIKDYRSGEYLRSLNLIYDIANRLVKFSTFESEGLQYGNNDAGTNIKNRGSANSSSPVVFSTCSCTIALDRLHCEHSDFLFLYLIFRNASLNSQEQQHVDERQELESSCFSRSSITACANSSALDSAFEVIIYFKRQLELFYGPLNLAEVTECSKSRQLDRNELQLFMQRFMLLETADLCSPQSWIMPRFPKLRYASSSQVGFLKAQLYLNSIILTPIRQQEQEEKTIFHSSALFYKGHFACGTAQLTDLETLYAYLLCDLSGTLYATPSEKFKKCVGVFFSLNVSDLLQFENLNTCNGYGDIIPKWIIHKKDAYDINVINPAKELEDQNYIGYIFGAYPFNFLTKTLHEDSSPEPFLHSIKLFIPCLYLTTSNIFIYPIIFQYINVTVILFYERLGFHDSNDLPTKAKFDNRCYHGPSFLSATLWFQNLTKNIFTPELKDLEHIWIGPHMNKTLNIQESRRFLYCNTLSCALRKSTNNIVPMLYEQLHQGRPHKEQQSQNHQHQHHQSTNNNWSDRLTQSLKKSLTSWKKKKNISSSSKTISFNIIPFTSLEAQWISHITSLLTQSNKGNLERVLNYFFSHHQNTELNACKEKCLQSYDKVEKSNLVTKEEETTNDKMTDIVSAVKTGLAHQLAVMKKNKISRVAVKPMNTGWIIGRRSMDRIVFLVGDVLEGVSLQDVLDEEQNFLNEKKYLSVFM